MEQIPDLAWTTLFSHPDQLTLTKSNLLTTLPVLPREWKVDFMFMPTLVTNTEDYKSILHLTDKEEKNTASYGGRVPALWLHDNGALHIECAQNNTGTFWDFSVPNPPVGKWTQITITQEILSEKSWYRVFIDRVERYKTRNAQDREFSDVRVFASNPWHSAQPGYIKNLSIKEKANVNNPTLQPKSIIPKNLPWTTLFSHPEQLALSKGNLLTTLSALPTEWKVDFMFKPTSVRTTSGYKSILHLTNKEEKNTRSYGGRIPALWISSSGFLHIESASNNTGTNVQTLPRSSWKASSQTGRWTQITITQEILSGKSWYRVLIDGVERYKTENAQDGEFQNVLVYASNPWHSAQPGYIKNLSIKERA